MRLLPARALLVSLALAACADGRARERSEQPGLAAPGSVAPPHAISYPDPLIEIADEDSTDGLDPTAQRFDAGTATDASGSGAQTPASEAQAPARSETSSESGARADDTGKNEGADPRCQPGARRLFSLSVDARAEDTVLLDDRFIYFQDTRGSGAAQRQAIRALPRGALFEPEASLAPLTILRDDFAMDALVDGGDAYLFFIALRNGDDTNQGLFRVLKRERAGIESLPIHARSSDDYWPGQLAADEDAFYLASVGASSHSLRIVRFARRDNRRDELWSNGAANNDGDTSGAQTLRDGDIALDARHLYFSLRIDRAQATPDFHIYRLDKEGSAQTPQRVTTITSRYGGLASDGAHLFFSHQGMLEQYDLASGAREPLVAQQGMRDLSYADGVLSWASAGASAGTLMFFCL